MRFGVHVEVDFSALPGVADFTKACGDQTQERGNVWKNSDDSGPSFELLVDTLDHIAGTHFYPMLRGQVKNSEGLRDVGFQPHGKLGGAFGVSIHHLPQEGLRGAFVWGAQDGA